MGAALRRLLVPGVLLLLGCALAALLFWHTLGFGFVYDDYHTLHPYTTAELRSALTGSWDPTGIEVAFYRPLTTAMYAARFQWLRLDASLYHALSVAVFGLCAGLCGLFAHRASGRMAPAVLSVLAFVAIPVMPAAQVAWVTNQMHLAESLLVLAALLCWQWSLTRGGFRWGLVFPLAAAAFLVKEDAVVLLPALLVLSALRRALVSGRGPWLPPAWVMAGSVALVAGLLAIRWFALGQVGGYGIPSFGVAVANFWRGPRAVLAFSRLPQPWRGSLAYATAALAGAASVAAFFGFKRLKGEIFVALSGVVVLTMFNLPFALVSKPEQYHLIGLGGALLLSGSFAVLWAFTNRLAPRAVVVLAASAMIGTMAWTSRLQASQWGPLTPRTLEQDEIVLGWTAVPVELREAIASKVARLDPTAVELGPRFPYVGYGVYDWETEAGGSRFRWTSGHAKLLVAPDARALAFTVRAPHVPPGKVVTVELVSEGLTVQVLSLSDGGPVRVTIPMARQGGPWRPRARWVDIGVTPDWSPRDDDPASSDDRRLGVRIGEIRLVW